jgi:septum formation protein
MIVLASTSPIRRQLLRQAGVPFKTARPAVDEPTIATALKKAGATPAQVADHLAEAKAASVGLILPNAFVIGADQMLECGGRWYDKPADRAAARAQLESLRGKTHRLISAAVIYYEGNVIWRQSDSADMTMRNFTDGFLDSYFEVMPDAALLSVGAYQMEGIGIQLFERFAGDYFTILGLPLLPLLEAMRQVGALPA